MGYTDIEAVRKGLPGLLYTVDYLGRVESGTYVPLNIDGIDCPTILKDGVEITKGSGFTFTRPDTLTLDVAADDEEYFARVYTGTEDEMIDDLIIQSDQIIDNKFYMYTQLAPSDVQKKTWSTYLTCGLYLSSYCGGSEEDITKADFFLNLAHSGMDAYIKFTLRDTPTRPNRHKVYCRKV